MIDHLLAQAEGLGKTDHVNAIPDLAKMDREAVGWFWILLWGPLGLAVGLAWLILELVLLGYVFRVGLPIAMDFAQTIFPIWRNPYPFNQVPAPQFWQLMMSGASYSRITNLPVQGAWYVWAGLLAGVVYFLYQSKGVRERLKSLTLWPASDRTPPWPVLMMMQVVRGLAWLGILMFVGGFLALALMPLVRFGMVVAALVELARQNWRVVNAAAVEYWYILAGGAVGLALFIYLIRKSLKGRVVRVIVTLMAMVGLGDMIVQMVYYQENSWVFLALLGVMVVYPIGLAVPLSGLVLPPFSMLRSTMVWIYERVLMRALLWEGVEFHKQRNRRQTQGRIWGTVCKKDLVRLEPRSERLSYNRWLTYGCCPVCGDDHQVYNGVKCIALSIDASMPDKICQTGTVLWLNGQDWLNAAGNASAPVFDSVVIGQTEKHLVEGMVVRYKNQPLTARHRPLKSINVRISKDMTLDQNTIRMLSDNFETVQTGYDAVVEPSPAARNWETHDLLHKQTVRVKQGFQKLSCAVLVAVAAGLALIGFYLFIPEARSLVTSAFLALQQVWMAIAKMGR